MEMEPHAVVKLIKPEELVAVADASIAEATGQA